MMFLLIFLSHAFAIQPSCDLKKVGKAVILTGEEHSHTMRLKYLFELGLNCKIDLLSEVGEKFPFVDSIRPAVIRNARKLSKVSDSDGECVHGVETDAWLLMRGIHLKNFLTSSYFFPIGIKAMKNTIRKAPPEDKKLIKNFRDFILSRHGANRSIDPDFYSNRVYSQLLTSFNRTQVDRFTKLYQAELVDLFNRKYSGRLGQKIDPDQPRIPYNKVSRMRSVDFAKSIADKLCRSDGRPLVGHMGAAHLPEVKEQLLAWGLKPELIHHTLYYADVEEVRSLLSAAAIR